VAMLEAEQIIQKRLKNLEQHLQEENPILVQAVETFRELDVVAYKLGLLNTDESFATQISWWPLISILGTFSAGKSTFINHYLDYTLQRTGNQAVDEKFTVMCHSNEATPHALPGVALDSDPRFPFYRMSEKIEKVAAGEGERIDAYLQLKTCPTNKLRGKILIDSPGFDADAQRTSTLRITDHIIGLSDLVLIFFDARHPEPGAMRDTLEHLVSKTFTRGDSGKFLYILNQIDTTAKEDNPEDVVAAWQRALGEKGLTAGRFYTIYNPDSAVPIEPAARRERYESKRDADLAEIHGRMKEVEIERAYRIVSDLEKNASQIREHIIPALEQRLSQWKRGVLWGDAIAFSSLFILALILSFNVGYWETFSFAMPFGGASETSPIWFYLSLSLLVICTVGIHFGMRALIAKMLRKKISQQEEVTYKVNFLNAFRKNTKSWRSIFLKTPSGWNKKSRQQLIKTLQHTDNFVQSLNDQFTNPAGKNLAVEKEQEIEPVVSTMSTNL